MWLRDGRIVVLVGDEPKDGRIPVFFLKSILGLRKSKREITLDPTSDFQNGYDVGLVPCSPHQWRRVQRFTARDDFVTLEMRPSGSYRWGFVTEAYLRRHYGLTDIDVAWLGVFVESMVERAQQESRASPPPKKPKHRLKRKERRVIESMSTKQLTPRGRNRGNQYRGKHG